MSGQDTRILTLLERIGIACAWAVLPIGLIVLVGYTFGVIPMTRLFLNAVFMTPNAAVLVCLLGTGLLLKLEGPPRPLRQVVSKGLTLVTGLIATAVLIEYLFGVNFGIDLILFPALVTDLFREFGGLHPGRFALTTAICLSALSVAGLAMDSTQQRDRRLANYLALGSLCLCGFFLVAYLYGATVPANLVRHFAIMAPHTAIAITLLSCAIMFSRPQPDGAALFASRSLGGVLLWRLLPVALFFPVILGGINVMARRLDLFEPEYGLAIMTVVTAALFGAVVWWTALKIDQLDTASAAQAQALRQSEERFRNIVETANEGIWILDLGARTSYVNKRLQDMLGYTSAEMQGRPLYDFVSNQYVAEAHSHFESRMEGNVESYDFQFQRKDGSTLWAIVNSTPLKDSLGRFDGVLKMVSDITLRKQAEEELRLSEEALQRAQQVAHIGSWQWEVERDRVNWSDELYRIYGVDPDNFAASFEAYIAHVHPDDRDFVQQLIGTAFQNCSESFTFEHRILRPDGTMRYLDCRGECLSGPNGQVALMRGTAQDISERKQAELALREAQEHFQSVLDNAGMSIAVKDLRGRYMVANAEAAEALGVTTSAELIGKRDEELVGAEIAAQIRATDHETMQSEVTLNVEQELPTADSSRHFWTSKFPMRDAHGTVIGVGVISQEITELRHAERALRESESLNRSILEAALDAVVSIDANGKILSWNRQAEELFGWSPLEAIGKPITIIIPDRYRDPHNQGMARFRETGEAPVVGKVLQVEARHQDGREFPVDLAIGQAASSSGEVSFSAFIRDISDRRRAEKEVRDKSLQLEELNSEMQVALQELANSHQLLQDQAAALERSNADLDDFAYIASHDLKEPLRGISNYAHFLHEDYSDKIDESGREMLATLPRLTKRLESLLDALLKYSRLNRAEVVPLPTDLGDVVEEVKEMLDVRIREANVEIRVPRPLPTIMCDRSQTTEIFLNLISNGIKYNEEPVKLVELGYVIESELAPEMGSTASGNGKTPPGQPSQRELIFYVSDNGIGIPEKYHDTVFGAFRRLHSREKYGGGTGVGLAIVKKMVERQGGRIWVESEPGRGSTFYFTLNPEVVAPGAVN